MYYKMKRFVILHLLTIVLLRNFKQIQSCNDGFYQNGVGSCERCPDNCQFCSSEEYCLSCKHGYAGRTCDYYCSKCLPGTSCDKVTFFCSQACKDGLSGVLCNIDCYGRCLSCNRTDHKECLTCATDRYGAECKSCPVSCTNQTCDQQGFCTLGCKPGYWGQMCEKVCSEHCIDNSCLRENGTCTYGCEEGSSGSNCNKTNNEEMLSRGVVVIIIVLPVTLAAVTLIIVCMLKRKISSRLTERKNVDSTTPSGEDVPLNQFATENVTTDNQAGSCKLNVDDSNSRFTNEETRIEVATEAKKSSDGEPKPDKNVDKTEITIQEFKNYVRDKSTDNYRKELQQLDGFAIGKKLRELTTDRWTFVDGYREDKKYATCKGGNDWADVLRKILFRRSDILVLFTPQNYNKIFPEKDKTMKYGDVDVTCTDEVRDTWLITRKLNLQMRVKELFKEEYFLKETVTLHQYLVSSDDLTKGEHNLSRFQKIVVRDTISKTTEPYFVLCSNDCDGYVGTFIALDMLLDKAEHTGSVDVYECVKKLRDDMVSVAITSSQYQLLHKALAMSLAQKQM